MTIIDDHDELTITDDHEETAERRVSRRTFVAGTGALVVGFTLPRYLNPGSARAAAPLPPPIPLNVPPAKPVNPVPTASDGPAANAIDSWVRIGANNIVTIFSGKCELGTGTATATLQVAADELSVTMEQLRFVDPDTQLTVDQGVTAGSMTMKTQWAQGVRQACAAARAQLLNLASNYLGEPASALYVSNGVVHVSSDPVRYVTYGELIGDKNFNTNITVNVTPMPVSDLRFVGKSVPRIDIPEKATREVHVRPGRPGARHAPRAGRASSDRRLDARRGRYDAEGRGSRGGGRQGQLHRRRGREGVAGDQRCPGAQATVVA